MTITNVISTRFFAALLLLQTAILFSPAHLNAQASLTVALAGRVSSQEEGPMEGVLVNAKKAGSTITVTVVSDQKGRYSFPRNRLEPGEYSLGIRAVGYEIDPATVTVTPQKAATSDLKLRKTQDLSAQLTNAEWLMSMPGGEQRGFLLNCTMCHTLQRIVRSNYDVNGFMHLLADRMSRNAPGSWPGKSPLFPGGGVVAKDLDRTPERFRKQAEFLSKVNLGSASNWEYPLKTLPRPKGRATRMIVTAYDLPRKDAHPHDVIRAADGSVYYMDFMAPYFGKLDTQTGQVTDFQIPILRPKQPAGGLEVQEDKDGYIWIALKNQGTLAKFDKKSQSFQMFTLPEELDRTASAEVSMVAPAYSQVDGKVWVRVRGSGSLQLARLDLASGKFEPMKPLEGHGTYGISADSQNNVYFLDILSEYVGRVDAKTLEVKYFRTPTLTSVPRRGHIDSRDHFLFAEFVGNKVGMFDTRTEQFQEWAMPTPWTDSYDAVADKNGEVWTGGMESDRIVRVNSKTGQTTEYLLPQSTNVRRVFVDNSTTPVTFWVGNNNNASIMKLEPME